MELLMISVCFLIIRTSTGTMFTTGTPQFDITPLNVTAISGQQAILPCSVQDKGDRQMIWMNPKRVLISTGDRRVMNDRRMSIERPFIKDWNLHIRDVQVEDNGEYQCQINTNPIQIRRIRLTVLVPARIENSTSSNDTLAREGATIELTCTAEGVPEPSITWYRKTMNSQQAREHVGTTGEMLIIHNISRHCGGFYECEASNNVALPVRRKIKVDVEFPPEVTFRTPRRVGQVRGREVMLECFIAAYPNGVSQWMRNGQSVITQDSFKYRTEIYKEDIFTVALYLRILNLDEHDFGSYTCDASNKLGKDFETMHMYEYTIPTPPPIPTTTESRYRPNEFWRSTQRTPGSGQGREPWQSSVVVNGGYVGVGEAYSKAMCTIGRTLVLSICLLVSLTLQLVR